MKPKMPRIIPLNLPAQLQFEVAGNPATSRLESGVANCFPGLEIDHRNLDRRFFPGLIFEFGGASGARVVDVDLADPDIKQDDELRNQLLKVKDLLSSQRQIQLISIAQENNKIKLTDGRSALGGLVVWRLIRSIEPGNVTIELDSQGSEVVIEMTAARRTYQNPDGSLAAVYRAGELGQSLCSPWQHDFRDCSCTYWASNHPDIILQGDTDSDEAEAPLAWMRFKQEELVRADPKGGGRSEMEYFEINKRWQELPMVLEGRQFVTPYSPSFDEPVDPLPPSELPETLRDLAGLEHAIALEYMYARYSLKVDERGLTDEERGHAEFIGHELFVIAASEMLHLRWVNQLLWELWHQGHMQKGEPALNIGKVPRIIARNGRGGSPLTKSIKPKMVEPEMRPLTEAIKDFTGVEAASGTRGGQYARVFATLRDGYAAPLAELVSRIIADGFSHFLKLRQIDAILRYHKGGENLVRQLTLLKPDDERCGPVRDAYKTILENLHAAYAEGNVEDRHSIPNARDAMIKIDKEAQELARQGLGVPFNKIGQGILASMRL